MPAVTIIDYGIGNLLSVARVFEYCNASVILTDDARSIAEADYLVLPGVGAFSDGMNGLRERGIVDPIKEFVAKERPFLGICLGMQMMLDKSDEFGSSSGLGLIPGSVVAIPPAGNDGTPHKIPHIGWNELHLPESRSSWQGTILADISPGACGYFVHSYTAVPCDPVHRLADSDYNGRQISSAIQKGNMFGCQFHPEKSGEVGHRIIKKFIES